MLDENFNIKIGDFGLARMLKTIEEERDTRCGTPNYIAPEVIKQPYTIKADMWSFGVIIYKLVTGKAPFESQKSSEVLKKLHESTNIEYSDEIPKQIRSLLILLLDRNEDSRASIYDVREHEYIRL